MRKNSKTDEDMANGRPEGVVRRNPADVPEETWREMKAARQESGGRFDRRDAATPPG